MISKNTNENGVKLLTVIAVLAIALVGLAAIPVSAEDNVTGSGAESDPNSPVVSVKIGAADPKEFTLTQVLLADDSGGTFKNTIEGASGDVTVTILKNIIMTAQQTGADKNGQIEIPQTSGNKKVTIEGEGKTITFTGSDIDTEWEEQKIVLIVENDDTEIKDLKIEGTGAVRGAINLFGAGNVILNQVEIRGFTSGYSLIVGGDDSEDGNPTKVVLKNCSFDNQKGFPDINVDKASGNELSTEGKTTISNGIYLEGKTLAIPAGKTLSLPDCSMIIQGVDEKHEQKATLDVYGTLELSSQDALINNGVLTVGEKGKIMIGGSAVEVVSDLDKLGEAVGTGSDVTLVVAGDGGQIDVGELYEANENLKNLTIISNGDVSLEGNLSFTENDGKSVTVINSGFNGTVKLDGKADDAAKLDIQGSFTLSYGSVKISDAQIATGSMMVYEDMDLIDATISGSLVIDAPEGKKPVLTVGNVTMGPGSSLTIGENIQTVQISGTKVKMSGEAEFSNEAGTPNVEVIPSEKCSVDVSGQIGGLIIPAGATVNVTEDTTIAGDADVQGTLVITSGKTLTLKGNTTVASTGEIKGDSATANLKNSGTLVIRGQVSEKISFENTKTIRVYNKDFGDVEATSKELGDGTNSGTIYIMELGVNHGDISGTGTVDTSAISKTIYISGTFSGNTPYDEYQTVIINGDTTVYEGNRVIVLGTFTINEGVTLTIQKGASMIIGGSVASLTNNGTIVVESDGYGTAGKDAGLLVIGSSKLVNNGTIELDFAEPSEYNENALAFGIFTKAYVENKGVITVSEDSALAIDADDKAVFSNTKDGVITVEGTLDGKVSNSGEVIFNSTEDQNADISIDATGTVDIQKMAGKITIDDKGLKFKKESTSSGYTYGDEQITMILTRTGDTDAYLSGLKVSASTFKDKVLSGDKVETYTRGQLVLSGTPTVSTASNNTSFDSATVKATITSTKITGGANADVSFGDLTLGNYIGYTQVDGTVNVDGTVTVGATAKMVLKDTTSAIAILNGSLTAVEGTAIINEYEGASYETAAVTGTTTPAMEYWTTVGAALAAADGKTIKDVKIMGCAHLDDANELVAVGEDITVPAGVTVSLKGELLIKSGKTLTIADGAFLKKTEAATVDVDGKLVIENNKNGLKGITSSDIEAEVIATEGIKDVYTSLASAIADAGEAEITIKLQRYVEVKTDLTIPSNVTVESDDKTEENGQSNIVVVFAGATLTVDGKLVFVDAATLKALELKPKDDAKGLAAGAVVVNGFIKSDGALDFTDEIDGAYYTTDDQEYRWIAGIANAPSILTSADSTVVIYGDITSALTFTAGDDANNTKLTIYGDILAPISATGVEITVAGMDAEQEKGVAADITVSDSTVIINSGVKISASVIGANGSIVMKDVKAGESGAVFAAGTVSSTDLTETLTVSKKMSGTSDEGKVTIKGDVYLGGFEVAGAPVVIEGNAVATEIGNSFVTVTVDGTLLVKANAAVRVSGYIEILGTVTVEDKTTTASQGKLDVANGTIYLGMTKKVAEATTGAAASLIGPEGSVTFASLIVAPGAFVSEALLKNGSVEIDSTEYYVEGALYATAYGENTEIYSVKYTNPEVEFNGWYDSDDELMTALGSNAKVSDHESVTAKLNYNVYSVRIIGDAGVGSVALNGVILTGAGNTFETASPFKAGTYTFTATANSGYDISKLKLTDADGKEVSSIVLSGDYRDCDIKDTVGEGDDAVTYYYQVYYLSGSVASSADTPSIVIPSQPAEKDDDMGITEYLLIVLVVLAAILVVVVAIRMMRS